jgi:hypothetical protein
MSVPRGRGGRFTHQDIIEEQCLNRGGILKPNIEDGIEDRAAVSR